MIMKQISMSKLKSINSFLEISNLICLDKKRMGESSVIFLIKFIGLVFVNPRARYYLNFTKASFFNIN